MKTEETPQDEAAQEESLTYSYKMHCSSGFPILRAEVNMNTPELMELSTFGTIELDRDAATALIRQLMYFVDGTIPENMGIKRTEIGGFVEAVVTNESELRKFMDEVASKNAKTSEE